MATGHTFYQIISEDEKEIIHFGKSSDYDTLSPYKFCSNELFRLNEQIKNGLKMKIVTSLPYDPIKTTYINDTLDFKKWIQQIFKGNFDKTYETIMN